MNDLRESVTCVVPTLNSARTLDMTLLSLRSQRHVRVEVRVVDSGSQDDTVAICERWGFPVQYVPPGNMYRAINAGLRDVTSEWLSYLNSDDMVYPDSYSRLAERGTACGADVVYGHADYIDAAGRFRFGFKPPAAALLPRLFRRGIMGFAQPATIFRRELYSELRGFAETLTCTGDFDFFLRARQMGRTFAELGPPSVAAFRLHAAQLSQRAADVARGEMELLVRRSGARKVRGDVVALACWRATNLGNYLVRLLRTGSLRMQ